MATASATDREPRLAPCRGELPVRHQRSYVGSRQSVRAVYEPRPVRCSGPCQLLSDSTWPASCTVVRASASCVSAAQRVGFDFLPWGLIPSNMGIDGDVALALMNSGLCRAHGVAVDLDSPPTRTGINRGTSPFICSFSGLIRVVDEPSFAAPRVRRRARCPAVANPSM